MERYVVITERFQKPCWFKVIDPLLPCFFVSFCKIMVKSQGSQREVSCFSHCVVSAHLCDQQNPVKMTVSGPEVGS